MKNQKKKLISALIVVALLTTLAFTSVFAFLHEGDAWNYGTNTQSDTKMCYSHFYCPVETHRATAEIYFMFWDGNVTVQKPAGQWANANTVYKPIYWSTGAYYSH